MTTNLTQPYQEPNFDLAQLVSAELFSPKVDETVKFFTELLGMPTARSSRLRTPSYSGSSSRT